MYAIRSGVCDIEDDELPSPEFRQKSNGYPGPKYSEGMKRYSYP